MTMLAEIRVDPQVYERRRAQRRSLRLPSEGSADEGVVSATVRNLSETGLLIEADEDFASGDAVTVNLPMVGAVAAKVVWARAPFFGCEFARLVPRSVVSAALLRSPIDEPPVELLGPADTTWQLPGVTPVVRPAVSTKGAVTSLVLLGLAIVVLIATFAVIRTV